MKIGTENRRQGGAIAGRRQSRRQGEHTLSCNGSRRFVPIFVRGRLLCLRRHGKQDQGTAGHDVRGPDELPRFRGESISAVAFRFCVRFAGDDTSKGFEGNEAGEGPVRYDSYEIAEDRGCGEGECVTDFVRVAEFVPACGSLGVGRESSFGPRFSGIGLSFGQSETFWPPLGERGACANLTAKRE